MAVILNADKFAENVISTIKKSNGMKLRELVNVYWSSHSISQQEMESFIQSMIKEHKLIALEYTTDMSTIGIFLLPPNTRTNIIGVPPSPPRRVA